ALRARPPPRRRLPRRVPRRRQPVPPPARRARPAPRAALRAHGAVPGGAEPVPAPLFGPTVLRRGMGGRRAGGVCVGLARAGAIWASMLVWLVLWALYVSIVNVGQTFYSFGWESLLCEVGALAILLGDARTAPPVLLVFLMRWLLFRLEFGAGLIKVRGDRCWRDLTCLHYHHETQPMPNPLSWYFHRLPRRLHRVEVLGNHFAQLVAPFGLFAPQPVAEIAAAIMILTQA